MLLLLSLLSSKSKTVPFPSAFSDPCTVVLFLLLPPPTPIAEEAKPNINWPESASMPKRKLPWHKNSPRNKYSPGWKDELIRLHVLVFVQLCNCRCRLPPPRVVVVSIILYPAASCGCSIDTGAVLQEASPNAPINDEPKIAAVDIDLRRFILPFGLIVSMLLLFIRPSIL